MYSKVFSVLVLLGFAEANVSYEGYKVYNVLPKTANQNLHLKSLENVKGLDFWSKINKVGNPVVIMVPPHFQESFENNLNSFDVEYFVQIENVESVFKEEREYHRVRQAHKRDVGFDLDVYHRHAEINAYLDQLAADYPDVVTIENIGKSYENREMNVIRISSGPRDPAKPIIFVDAGIHAREWIAPAVALYLIYQLVEVPANSYLLEDVDWIILPSVNPDGYEFCWTTDRLWRKTVSAGEKCNGCDANRNFDFHWMEIGADDAECSDIYAGKEPFSEVETRNLRDYLLKTDNIKAYLTLHSFGQYLLYPWGFTPKLPSNWQELDDLGKRMNKAIEAVNGTTYEVGSSTNVLYAASGASDDYAMGVDGIDIVYTMELPGGGLNGFDMPASRITAVGIETFEGFKVLAEYVANNRS